MAAIGATNRTAEAIDELATDANAAPNSSLVGTYLIEAAESLRRSCGPELFHADAPALAAKLDALPAGHEENGDLTTLSTYIVMGSHERVNLSRTSILNSAFAAEAAVNEFIAARCAGADRQAIDRLRTPDKVSIAPRLALGINLFPRGAEPLTSLEELFDLRNDLVHPKPGAGYPTLPYGLEADPVFCPKVAARYLLQTSRVTSMLGAQYQDDSVGAIMASAMNSAANSIRAYAAAATKKMPSPSDPPRPTFIAIMMKKQRSKARALTQPDPSIAGPDSTLDRSSVEHDIT